MIHLHNRWIIIYFYHYEIFYFNAKNFFIIYMYIAVHILYITVLYNTQLLLKKNSNTHTLLINNYIYVIYYANICNIIKQNSIIQ